MSHTEERNERVKTSLLAEHSADAYGIWQIKGEDGNVDFAGPHHMPTLGFFEGTYADIVEYAVNLKSFWSWGAGGSISLVSVTRIEAASVRELKETTEALAALKEQEEILIGKLEKLGSQ